jgi:hypothetical protein
VRINLGLKGRGSLMSEKGEGEGYRHYPSPQCGLGFPQCPKQYFIDTTDFGFNQGSLSFRASISLAKTRELSSVWSRKALGPWVCLRVF